MTLNVVVLAAGEGKRFKEAGYKVIPKPFIWVLGQRIIERTTRSLPFIQHYDERPLIDIDYTLTFAIRTEHEQYVEVLEEIYGKHVRIIRFSQTTRGNLETARETTKWLSYKSHHDPLLILDADNQYDGTDFLWFVNHVKSPLFGAICYFEPLDDSAKWCFAFTGANNKIVQLAEKSPYALQTGGKPMVGVFYFSQTDLFENVADEILNESRDGEYYMSLSVQRLLTMGIDVYGMKVENVFPIGTPEDMENMLK